MKTSAFLLYLSLHAFFGSSASETSLKCYNCYVDGPRPLLFLRSTGDLWSACSGVASDVTDCDDGLCAEMLLYGGGDISKYQILRTCTFNEDVCDNFQIGSDIYVGKCRMCEDDYCNNKLK